MRLLLVTGEKEKLNNYASYKLVCCQLKTYIKWKSHICYTSFIVSDIFERFAGETIAICHISTLEIQQSITNLSCSYCILWMKFSFYRWSCIFHENYGPAFTWCIFWRMVMIEIDKVQRMLKFCCFAWYVDRSDNISYIGYVYSCFDRFLFSIDWSKICRAFCLEYTTHWITQWKWNEILRLQTLMLILQ